MASTSTSFARLARALLAGLLLAVAPACLQFGAKVSMTVTSVPSGAETFLVPLLDWDKQTAANQSPIGLADKAWLETYRKGVLPKGGKVLSARDKAYMLVWILNDQFHSELIRPKPSKTNAYSANFAGP